MRNECVIGGCAHDCPGGSQFKSRKIFLLTERDQGEPFAYLLYDAYALRPGNTWPKWQSGEGCVDLAERAKGAEIAFPCIKE